MVEDMQLVRAVDAARILNMNTRRLYSAIRSGKIKTYGPTDRYVYLEDVRAYLEMYGRRSGYKEYKKSA